ncbi:MAG: hypothetical protein ACK4HV_07710, partial [Parachlamydiaceae bacterium]
EEKIEFETKNGKLILPAYFKSLLEKDYSHLLKDPEKAERMKELSLKNQFRNITKEASTLYLATRFGTQHLDPIDEVSKETVLETVNKAYSSSYLNDSIFSIVKETLQKLDPSKLSDIKYVVDIVCALRTRLEIAAEVSLFFKKSLSYSKKYTLIDRFKKWLCRYLPRFIISALKLAPKQDLAEVIRILSPLGEGVWGFEFPFAIPNDKQLLYALSPLSHRIPILDLSEFKEIHDADAAFIARFKNLKEVILNQEIKLTEKAKALLKEVNLIYIKGDIAPPERDASKKIESDKPASACASSDGGDVSRHDDAKAEAIPATQAPPAADA